MPSKPVLSSGDKGTFRAILEGAAARPEFGVISNRFPWQAKMASVKLLGVAEVKKLPIRMLSGRCPEGFYTKDFCDKLVACKEAGVSLIRVMVWQKDAIGISPELLTLASSGTIELKVSGTDDGAASVPHFLLVGNNAFRQEAGHTPFTAQTIITDTDPQVPARIDFDDPVTGGKLCKFFDDLWAKA